MSDDFEQGAQLLTERLAEIGGRLQRQRPEEVESWIAEKFTDKETRQLLMVAMILLAEARGFGTD
jgi:hypothetical protein